MTKALRGTDGKGSDAEEHRDAAPPPKPKQEVEEDDQVRPGGKNEGDRERQGWMTSPEDENGTLLRAWSGSPGRWTG